MRRRLLFFVLVSLYVLTACTAKLERKIYPVFEVLYSEETDKTEITAVFREKDAFGDKTALTDRNAVKVGDLPMNFDPNLNRYYLSLNGKLPQTEIIWEDANGDIFVNTVNLNAVFGWDSRSDTLLTNRTAQLFWAGDSLAPEEMAFVRLHGKVIIQSQKGTNFFRLTPEEMQSMPQGNAVLSTPERKRRIPLASSNETGGDLWLTYRAKTKTIYLK